MSVSDDTPPPLPAEMPEMRPYNTREDGVCVTVVGPGQGRVFLKGNGDARFMAEMVCLAMNDAHEFIARETEKLREEAAANLRLFHQANARATQAEDDTAAAVATMREAVVTAEEFGREIDRLERSLSRLLEAAKAYMSVGHYTAAGESVMLYDDLKQAIAQAEEVGK